MMKYVHKKFFTEAEKGMEKKESDFMRQIFRISTDMSVKKNAIMNVVLLAVCLSFYLLFPFCDGPVWCVDSASYVYMDISREPLYPTFLALTGTGGG